MNLFVYYLTLSYIYVPRHMKCCVREPLYQLLHSGLALLRHLLLITTHTCSFFMDSLGLTYIFPSLLPVSMNSSLYNEHYGAVVPDTKVISVPCFCVLTLPGRFCLRVWIL